MKVIERRLAAVEAQLDGRPPTPRQQAMAASAAWFREVLGKPLDDLSCEQLERLDEAFGRMAADVDDETKERLTLRAVAGL